MADEPTGNLDSKANREIMDLLRLSNKKYKQTVIVITYDLNIALKADKMIMMATGSAYEYYQELCRIFSAQWQD